MSERPIDERHTAAANEPADRRRRAALAKLGLAVGAAYVAPTVLSIDRSARAMGPSCSKANAQSCR